MALLTVLLLCLVAACTGDTDTDWVKAPVSTTETVLPALAPTGTATAAAVAEARPVTLLTPGSSLILAHYMAWYKTPEISGRWQHWQWDPDGDGGGDPDDIIPDRVDTEGRHQIAAAHYPLIGPYDSSDISVIEYHMATAWAAGIDGFVIDWYGPQDRGEIDSAFRLLLDTADRWRAAYGLEFFLALTYEENILYWANLQKEQMETRLTEHLQYILDEYGQHPNYLRYNGIPVIFYFESWIDGQAGLLRPEQIALVQSWLPPFNLLYMGAEEAFLDVSDGFYSWVSGANDDPEDWGASYVNWVYPEMDYRTERHDLDLTIGSVWAAFDDSGVQGWGNTPRYIDPQGGAVYDQTWMAALAAKTQHEGDSTDWVQIVTWNDWNEGTEIEPSLEFGRAYLDATQRYAAQYTGRQRPGYALLIPERIYRLRQNTPGPEAEALIEQAYSLFFSGQFDAALTLLE